MTATAQNILKTLGYFDLFMYPLTDEEIYLFNPLVTNKVLVYKELEMLVREKTIFKIDDFYSLHNDYFLAERRRNGNLLAAEQIKTARRVAKFLYRFPYVKAIAVSGSLSKNFATDKTDIDFFIITAANRLWIARTCMHLYKKITFITGRQNWYCMNYYVDEEAMEIKEKNIFTAMEIITLLPMYGQDYLDGFIKKNKWTDLFFPLKYCSNKAFPEIRKGLFSKLVEKLFTGRFGDIADEKLMNITAKRWNKKVQQHKLNSKGGFMCMVIGRHFSKPDPQNFQQKTLNQYQAKVHQLLTQHKIKLAAF